MMRTFTFLLFFSLFSCDFPSNTENQEPKLIANVPKIDSSATSILLDEWQLEEKHAQMPVTDSSIFLGFKIGMSEKEFIKHKNQLAKQGKIKIQEDGSFSFLILEDMPKVYGLFRYYLDENSLFSASYDIIIKNDKKLKADINRASRAYEETSDMDTMLLKLIDTQIKEYQKRLLNLFQEKYQSKPIDFIFYCWYVEGKKIGLQFNDAEDIVTDFYTYGDDYISIGSADYQDMRELRKAGERYKKEKEEEEKRKKEDRLKNINI